MAPSPRPEPRTRGFVDRHVGPHAGDVDVMLAAIGYGSLDELVAAALPASIQELDPLDVPAAGSEIEVAAELRALADENQVVTSMIGLGYH